MPFGDFPICGIGGILRITPPGEEHVPIPDEWLDAIDDAIAWRGPDGAGRFRDLVVREDGTTVEVALVHRRLSIIDHAGGAQPMVSEQGRVREDGTREGLVAVVFNGCIYNHRELRAELEARGHVFVSDHSDTEVLIHAFRETESGSDTPLDHKPDGMFACAIWSRDEGKVTLLRSWTHEKPMYTTQHAMKKSCGTMAFASDPGVLRGLVAKWKSANLLDKQCLETWVRFGFSDAIIPDRDIESVEGFAELSGRTLEHRTLWKGVAGAALIAALIAVWSTLGLIGLGIAAAVFALFGAMRVVGMLRRPRGDPGPLVHAIASAVETRLDADVPLGCLLSGGVDSSLVAHFAMQELGRLTTVSVRMPDERYDESQYAEMVADHLGTDHHTIEVRPEPAEDLVDLIRLAGVPFGDSSLLPTYWACTAAREHAKVVLTGDGADELFYGYERYRAMIGTRWLRTLGMFLPLKLFHNEDPKSSREKLARLIVAGRYDGYAELLSIFPSPDFTRLRNPVLPSFRISHGHGMEHTTDPPSWGAIAAREWDFRNYLPGDLLRKTDIASMASGVELRAPFLDSELCEHVLRVDRKQLMPRNERKGLLKAIARQHLPPDIIDRPKMGFAIPVGEWFRDDFGGMRTLMESKLDRPEPFGPCHEVLKFNMDYIRTIRREHDERVRDHSQRLYMLTVLAVWADSLK